MRHLEFIDNDHFENNYHRVPPPSRLKMFIDFYWETKFDQLWKTHPRVFSDAQFPNIGYTYIFNLGTPYVMQVEDKKFSMRTDCFLPRYNTIECFHRPENHLFGIKFKISPVIFEKKINFSEYRGAVFPLSYLIDPQVSTAIKRAENFKERIQILTSYFTGLLNKHEDSLKAVEIVSKILDDVYENNRFNLSLEDEAARYGISGRSLLRYFEICTGIPGKKAIQVIRIRKAISQIIHDPQNFLLSNFGYHDKSHFYKHLRTFFFHPSEELSRLHLKILATLHGKT